MGSNQEKLKGNVIRPRAVVKGYKRRETNKILLQSFHQPKNY